ncbi:MAG: RimK family alpha-L-glutamate ligase [Nanoarchaeota archaeon]
MKVWLLTKKGHGRSVHNLRFKETAKKMGIECYVVNPEDLDIIVTKKGKSSIYYQGEYIKLPDCLIPRMGSGTSYFAHVIIRHLEHLGVFVLNSNESIATSKDKLSTLQLLKLNNLPIPKTQLAKFPINMKVVEKEFSFPIIVKTVSGSYGKGVFLCETKIKFKDTMDLIEISKDPNTNIIIQEFVKSSKGRDIRVMVVGGRPCGAMLRQAKRGKFKANYSAGGRVSNFILNKDVEWLAVESARVLGLDMAGVDILFDGDKYAICEVNSAPGFEGFEKATQIDYPKVVFDYIRVRLGIK